MLPTPLLGYKVVVVVIRTDIKVSVYSVSMDESATNDTTAQK